MASSSNFPKGEDIAEVPCRQDPSEVGTLSGRVPPLSRPYPPDYRAAFLRHLRDERRRRATPPRRQTTRGASAGQEVHPFMTFEWSCYATPRRGPVLSTA